MNVYFIIILFSLTKILTAWQNLKWNLFKTENEIFFTAATSCTSNWANQLWANHPIFLHTTFMHILSTKNKIDEALESKSIRFFPYIFTYYIYFYFSHNKRELRATEFTRTMKLLQLKDIFYIIQLRGDVRVDLWWTRDSVQSRTMYPIS